MSATIHGLDRLATWLQARLFVTNYRPVKLAEHAVIGRNIMLKVGSQTCHAHVRGILFSFRYFRWMRRGGVLFILGCSSCAHWAKASPLWPLWPRYPQGVVACATECRGSPTGPAAAAMRVGVLPTPHRHECGGSQGAGVGAGGTTPALAAQPGVAFFICCVKICNNLL